MEEWEHRASAPSRQIRDGDGAFSICNTKFKSCSMLDVSISTYMCYTEMYRQSGWIACLSGR